MGTFHYHVPQYEEKKSNQCMDIPLSPYPPISSTPEPPISLPPIPPIPHTKHIHPRVPSNPHAAHLLLKKPLHRRYRIHTRRYPKQLNTEISSWNFHKMGRKEGRKKEGENGFRRRRRLG